MSRKLQVPSNDGRYNERSIHGIYRANLGTNQLQNRYGCCYILKKSGKLPYHPEYNRSEECKHFSDVCHQKHYPASFISCG